MNQDCTKRERGNWLERRSFPQGTWEGLGKSSLDALGGAISGRVRVRRPGENAYEQGGDRRVTRGLLGPLAMLRGLRSPEPASPIFLVNPIC